MVNWTCKYCFCYKPEKVKGDLEKTLAITNDKKRNMKLRENSCEGHCSFAKETVKPYDKCWNWRDWETNKDLWHTFGTDDKVKEISDIYSSSAKRKRIKKLEKGEITQEAQRGLDKHIAEA